MWMLFAEVVKVMDHTRLWDAKLAWYSPSATRWICWSCDGDQPHWTERCWAHLIFFEFASMAWSIALEFIVLGPTDLAWLLRFLQPKQNFLNLLFTVFWSIAPSLFCITNIFGCFYASVMTRSELVKHKFWIKLHSISLVWLSNHLRSEAMHNVSVHQQPLYY